MLVQLLRVTKIVYMRLYIDYVLVAAAIAPFNIILHEFNYTLGTHLHVWNTWITNKVN